MSLSESSLTRGGIYLVYTSPLSVVKELLTEERAEVVSEEEV